MSWKNLCLFYKVYISELGEPEVIAIIIIHGESNYDKIRNISYLFTSIVLSFYSFPSSLKPRSSLSNTIKQTLGSLLSEGKTFFLFG